MDEILVKKGEKKAALFSLLFGVTRGAPWRSVLGLVLLQFTIKLSGKSDGKCNGKLYLPLGEHKV